MTKVEDLDTIAWQEEKIRRLELQVANQSEQLRLTNKAVRRRNLKNRRLRERIDWLVSLVGLPSRDAQLREAVLSMERHGVEVVSPDDIRDARRDYMAEVRADLKSAGQAAE